MASKTLYLVMTNISRNNGAIGRARSVIDLLVAAGADVTLVGMGKEPDTYRYPCRVVCIPGLSAFSMIKAAGTAVRLAVAEHANPVILSSFGNPLNPFIALTLKCFGKRVAYECQDPPVETMRLMYSGTPAGRLLVRFVELADPILAGSVSDVLSVSNGVSEILRRRGWKARIFPYLNIHSAIRDRGRPQRYNSLRDIPLWRDAQILIHVGALLPGIRGIEEQIQAVAIARAAGANVCFAAFGFGEPAEYALLAEQLGVAPYVHLSSPVPHEEIHAVLAEADFAAITMGEVPYSLPSKLFDYLTAGLRIFCDTRDEDVIDLCGELVAPFDGSAQALARLLLCPPPRTDPAQVKGFMERLLRENRDAVAAVLCKKE